MLRLSIQGWLVGHIWMSATECFKDLSYDITREEARSAPGTLRDHVLAATNDGDFQSCSIAGGELIAERVTERGGRRITVERRWPLTCFKSIADCLHPDPDWLPPYADDDY